jgi:putative membrane protein insertion efficiency factor
MTLVLRRLILAAIRAYQVLAPRAVRRQCRFLPSCSAYVFAAVERYGAGKGLMKGVRRISRCRPPYGGVDQP